MLSAEPDLCSTTRKRHCFGSVMLHSPLCGLISLHFLVSRRVLLAFLGLAARRATRRRGISLLFFPNLITFLIDLQTWEPDLNGGLNTYRGLSSGLAVLTTVKLHSFTKETCTLEKWQLRTCNEVIAAGRDVTHGNSNFLRPDYCCFFFTVKSQMVQKTWERCCFNLLNFHVFVPGPNTVSDPFICKFQFQ